MRLARCVVKEIYVKNDSDPGGKGEITFYIGIGSRWAEIRIGKYNVESGTTLKIDKVIDDVTITGGKLPLSFLAVDDDSNWLNAGAEDRADHWFELDLNENPLPQRTLWIRAAGRDGLNATIYFSLEHRGIFDGAVITLECLGHIPGKRYLAKLPPPPRVGLMSGFDGAPAMWRVADFGGGHFGFKHYDGSYWLDGNTVNGTVSLAPHPNSPYTGARWRVYYPNGGGSSRMRFECLGNVPGPRWLDGNTINGQVLLQPNTEFSGTNWHVW